jgi:F-type H+-transporting ATPase subunit b
MVALAKTNAQTEANKIIAQAQEAIKNEKRTAVIELKNQVAQISLEIAEKIIETELDNKDKQAQLVDKLLKDVSL